MAEKFIRIKTFLIKHSNIVFFVGGFLFDSLTLVRIDSTLDLAIQMAYLILLVVLITLKARFDNRLWQPPAWLQKLWTYESEAVHFFYGGLLSAYVIFYFKSTTFSRSFFFLALVVILMFLNEMPQIRRVGATMRLGLYSFCLISFLNYFLPVLIGQMGGLIFGAAWLLSASLTIALVNLIAKFTPEPQKNRWRLGWPPALILILVALLYSVKLIPPVPLSMQYAGIFQNVTRENNHFKLTYEKPPFYAFWRKDNRHFRARPGDEIYCFTRVFAPRRFTHQIYLSWFKKDVTTGRWQVSDRIPLLVFGGRDQGYRGYAKKSNYEEGEWRVDVQTEDGRTLGGIKFEVKTDTRAKPRQWKEIRM
ncbi:MAG: hypothetical protein KCHDKBKB_02307 [Elusimicrobia bacterium]|nr:hypothetical protein [Elusimicrobiota bacterium]